MLGNVVLLVVVARRDARPLAAADARRLLVRSPLLLDRRRCGCARTLFPATWDAQQRAGEVAGVVDEAVTGVRVVKGFGQEDRELAPPDRRRRETLYRSRVRLVRMQARLHVDAAAIPVLGQVGGARARRLAGDPGRDHARARSSRSPATSCSSSRRCGWWRRCSPSASRPGPAPSASSSILDSNPLVTEKPDAVDARPACAARSTSSDVRFGYLRSEPVLDDFDPHVRARRDGRARRRVGLGQVDGEPAAAPLLRRRRQGAITLDGVDVRDVTLDSLRRQIGVVFEDSFLFSDSVRDNIAYGRPDATDAEIEAAARAAGAHEFIRELPDGLRHGRRRARPHAVGRPAPARSPSPARCSPTRGPRPRRRHLGDRRRDRGGRSTRTLREVMAGPHDDPHRPPPLDAAARRPHRASSTAAGSWPRAPTTSCWHVSALYRDLLAGPGDERRGRPSAVDGPDSAASARRRRRGVDASRRPRHVADTGDPRTSARRRPRRQSARPAGRARSPGRDRAARRWRRRRRHRRRCSRHARAARRASTASRPPTTTPTSTSTPRRRPTTPFTLLRASSARSAGRWASGSASSSIDALLTLLGPLLIRQRHRPRRGRGHDDRALVASVRVPRGHASLDWVVTWAYTRVHRAARPSGCCSRCGSASSPTSSGCRSTTTTGRWRAGS